MIVQETAIPWRGALDWPHLSGFLGRRAIPAIESVGEDHYARGAVRVHVLPVGEEARQLRGIDDVTEGLRHFAAFRVDGKAMGQHLFVRRRAVNGHGGF